MAAGIGCTVRPTEDPSAAVPEHLVLQLCHLLHVLTVAPVPAASPHCPSRRLVQVSAAGIQTGLESLAEGGAPPKLLILDDGWQRTDVDEQYRQAGEFGGPKLLPTPTRNRR